MDLLNVKPYDLAQPYFTGMPHAPTHPPFLFGLTKKHGEFRLKNGGSSAADCITFGGHLGTHIDALNHFSCGGKLYGGHAVDGVQSYSEGVKHLSVDTIVPIVRRAVLLDIAQGEPLPKDFSVTPDHLEATLKRQNTQIQAGDIVLLRTGWARFWDDAARFVSELHCPGPELPGAQWLSERRIFAAGSDTIPFEKMPSQEMPVHVHLLVNSGIHIIENLNLEELARDRVYEFVFVGAPLKIRGGTGAPLRPLAFPIR
jgi:kynurenine formamidase